LAVATTAIEFSLLAAASGKSFCRHRHSRGPHRSPHHRPGRHFTNSQNSVEARRLRASLWSPIFLSVWNPAYQIVRGGATLLAFKSHPEYEAWAGKPSLPPKKGRPPRHPEKTRRPKIHGGGGGGPPPPPAPGYSGPLNTRANRSWAPHRYTRSSASTLPADKHHVAATQPQPRRLCPTAPSPKGRAR